MIFTPDQVEELLRIMEYHYSFVIGRNLGFDVLSDAELFVLKLHGIDPADYKDMPIYDQMYYFGRLSSVLRKKTELVEYKDFKKFISTGQYQPLTPREKMELNYARKATYTRLKGLKGRAWDYFSGRLTEAEHELYRQRFEGDVKTAMEQGVAARKTSGGIVSDLGHQVGTWAHDWGRIVETEMNDIFQQGRVDNIIEKYGPDAMVYKSVFGGACRHCIRLYLTDGIGSKPVLFKVKDLLANGTNHGRKSAEWLPVVGSTHPYCRCNIVYVPGGYIWNEEKKMFEIGEYKRKVERKSKIKISIGDNTMYV